MQVSRLEQQTLNVTSGDIKLKIGTSKDSQKMKIHDKNCPKLNKNKVLLQ